MQASFQKQQHIDPQPYVLALKQGTTSTYLNIWISIKYIFIYLYCVFIEMLQDHILACILAKSRHRFGARGGFELIKWPDWQVTLVSQCNNKATSRQMSSHQSGCILWCSALPAAAHLSGLPLPSILFLVDVCLLCSGKSQQTKVCSFSQFAFMHFLDAVCNGQTSSESNECQRRKTHKKKVTRNNLDDVAWPTRTNKKPKVHSEIDVQGQNLRHCLYGSVLTHLCQVIQYLSECLIGNLITSLVL